MLWIAEQLPGLVSTSDEAARLVQSGIFTSFNEPYLDATRVLSGAAAYDEHQRQMHNSTPGYQLGPRAHLFRAYGHLALAGVEGAKTLIRWNKWQTDPVISADPDTLLRAAPAAKGALASRGDLNPRPPANPPPGQHTDPIGPMNSVATNALLVSSALMAAGETLAVGGPTHDDQPPFQWSTAPPEIQAPPPAPRPRTPDARRTRHYCVVTSVSRCRRRCRTRASPTGRGPFHGRRCARPPSDVLCTAQRGVTARCKKVCVIVIVRCICTAAAAARASAQRP